MKLREVKKVVSGLSFEQLVRLDGWLHSLIKSAEKATARKRVASNRIGNKTYQSELVRCGKKGCKCAEGELHGPYWYAYWTEGGRTKSEYVGKNLPRGVRRS